MKILILSIVLVVIAGVVLTGCFAARLGGPVQTATPSTEEGSLWDFTTETLEGESVDLSAYQGQVALVVNVASKCGLTSQYEGLVALQDEFGARGFTVLGFPSNDFFGQEPGTAEEIRTFCSSTYGVDFPLFAKRVVSGSDKDEVFAFLSRDLEEPTWNFTKYLIARDGRVLARFAPRTKPDDAELRMAIEGALEG